MPIRAVLGSTYQIDTGLNPAAVRFAITRVLRSRPYLRLSFTDITGTNRTLIVPTTPATPRDQYVLSNPLTLQDPGYIFFVASPALHLEFTDGTTSTVPMLPAVTLGERWVVMSYLGQNLEITMFAAFGRIQLATSPPLASATSPVIRVTFKTDADPIGTRTVAAAYFTLGFQSNSVVLDAATMRPLSQIVHMPVATVDPATIRVVQQPDGTFDVSFVMSVNMPPSIALMVMTGLLPVTEAYLGNPNIDVYVVTDVGMYRAQVSDSGRTIEVYAQSVFGGDTQVGVVVMPPIGHIEVEASPTAYTFFAAGLHPASPWHELPDLVDRYPLPQVAQPGDVVGLRIAV